jgi:hypothetical protein
MQYIILYGFLVYEDIPLFLSLYSLTLGFQYQFLKQARALFFCLLHCLKISVLLFFIYYENFYYFIIYYFSI